MTQDQVDQVDELEAMTAEEVGESLTGWEEIAIEKATGRPLARLAEHDEIMLLRIMAAVDIARRRKVTFPEAYRAAMDMQQREVMDYFPDNPEPMPDEPVTAAGKDD